MALYQAENQNMVEVGDETPKSSTYEPIVVLELFTSQGCSSCPPADVLLNQVKVEFPKNVYALSYHVDYWNYIGWKDPFSKSVFTKKQGEYNRKFRYRSNYTPQMVVNGKEHFVGSNRSKLYTKINTYKNQKTSNEINITAYKRAGNAIAFDCSVSGKLDGKRLRAVLVLNERTTSVKRGENRNRTLKNSNIVIAEKYVDLSGTNGISSLAIPEIAPQSDRLSLIVLVEDDNLDITGAAQVSLP